MRPHCHPILLALAMVAVEANAAPMFVELADLPGGRNTSIAFAISGDGSTVVGWSRDDSAPRAVRWTALGTRVKVLGDLPGEIGSFARGVSGDGATAVGYAPPFGDSTAVAWSGGGIQPLGDLPGGMTESQAFGVSNDGQVIVGKSDSANTSEGFFGRHSAGIR